MNQEQLTKKLGKRILSEANDLKRTIGSLASEIGLQKDILDKIIKTGSKIAINISEKI